MKKSILVFLFIMAVLILAAQSIQIDALTSERTYNSFNMAQIDPDSPYGQPILFSWRITKTLPVGMTELPFDLNIRLDWDGVSIPLLDYDVSSKPVLADMNIINFTNRDIFTSIDTDKFYSSDAGISLDDLFDAAPVLEEVVLNTGLFPDGLYTLTVRASFIGGQSNASTITFHVKNANAIFLNYPGVPIGDSVPQIYNNIVVFNWQSNMVGINTFDLTIREFEMKEDFMGRDPDSSGKLFAEVEGLNSSVYSGFFPFNSGYYYAWKVSTPVTTESSPSGNSLSIESSYKIFQYTEDSSSTTNAFTDRIVELLRQFKDSGVNQLLDNGAVPTTTVITEADWLSGEKAIEKIKEFSGKPVKITIVEE